MDMDLSWLDSVVITADGGIDDDPLYCDGEREMILDSVLDTGIFMEYDLGAIANAVYCASLEHARCIERFALLAAEGITRRLNEITNAPKNSFIEAFAIERITQIRQHVSITAQKLGLDVFPSTTSGDSLPTL